MIYFCVSLDYMLHSPAILSSRIPRNTGWRILPDFVSSIYATLHTSVGSIQCASLLLSGIFSQNKHSDFGTLDIRLKVSFPIPETCPLYTSLCLSSYCASTSAILPPSLCRYPLSTPVIK